MGKIRVGLLSFSDGRPSVHQTLADYIAGQEARLRQALEATGQVEVLLPPSGAVCSNRLASVCAREIKAQLPDAMVFNVPVFAYPNFCVVTESILQLPVLVISNVNGGLPGLGGLQAACNFLRQCGYACKKVWGDISEPAVLDGCMSFLRAAYAANQLRGQVFGLIGGRSIGMGSGSASPDLWQRVFGVDVDHTDQSEILHRAGLVDEERVERAFTWLSECAQVRYDGEKLTPESLREQLRCYYATKSVCEEKNYSFIGVKCHDELSAHACTQCLSAAFFNDPYDWDGPKEPCVFSCEADCDGGLTMQILKLITGMPAAFADFRYYNREEDLLYLCNCGAMATWFAARSSKPEENLAQVSLVPIIPKYAGKGSHVFYIAKEGPMTFCRLTHNAQGFVLTAFTGTARRAAPEELEQTCPVWPHMVVRPDAAYAEILGQYDCNHIHAVCGDWIRELREFCLLKDIPFRHIC